MPVASKAICTYPGCNTLVLKGRCSSHPYPKSKGNKRRGYHRNWRDIREHQLRRTPLCEYRYKCNGSPATEVDHKDNDRLNNRADNLASACKPCHSYKTATVDMVRNESGKFTGYRDEG